VGDDVGRTAGTAGTGDKAVRLIALLGRKDEPTDGLEDYCTFLAEALLCHGVGLKKIRVDCADGGWTRALFRLWRDSKSWGGRWVLMQFTSLSWSRRGFPFMAVAVIVIVRIRGARVSVVYHESQAFDGPRPIDQLRRLCQQWVLRRLYEFSEKPVFADPLENVPWLPAKSSKAVSIPIGGNLPQPAPRLEGVQARNGKRKVVSIYCLSDPPNRARELEDISRAVEPLAANGLQLRLVFLGRGTPEARSDIEKSFHGMPVELSNLGIQSAAEVSRILSESDVMLCVRGRLFPRRGSAMAGIACGLPVVAYAGEADGTPLAEAGVELVPYRDSAALGRSLGRILEDRAEWEELHRRSLRAQERYFSWNVIAGKFVNALGVQGTQ
jgi:glycosyltransferase involved in cell wall biosynthesis